MKKFKLLLYIFTMVSLLASCKKGPIACFTTDQSSAAVNTPIKCDASCSKNAKDFIWLGSDPATVTPVNGSSSTVTYSYPIPGKYVIKLEVTNGKKEDIIIHNVTIY